MSLFKKAPIPTPDVERQDLADAIEGAPRNELQYLLWAEPELQYVEDALPIDEEILAVASCDIISLYASGFYGVIVVTPKRIVAVLGQRGKDRKPLGEPTVYTFPLAEASINDGVTSTGQPFTRFQVPGRASVELQVGHDGEWTARFFNAARKQANKSKLL